MNTFTYYFEELELLRGYSVLASGEADIEYRIAPAEPDVGIFEPWITDIEITAITVNPNGDALPLNLSQDHWLYKLIHDELIDSDNLLEACEEDAANNGDDYE